MNATDIVKARYGAVAESSLSSHHAGVRAVAEAFGYSAEELTSIPAQANMGLSCGNPTATAHLKPGEVVVDLGSGGGLDVFLAAKKVGPRGRAIGIDMTPAMIERARSNAASGGYTNVDFHLAQIEQVPLADATADCVISNCVLNLAPDKPAVFREIFRILKPGGRLAVSDIALKGELPEAIARSLAAYVGCIAGAIRIETYREELLKAGFEFVEILDSGTDLNAYAKAENQSGCCSPAMDEPGAFPVVQLSCCSSQPDLSALHDDLKSLLAACDVNKAAASVRVYAIKPSQPRHESFRAETANIRQRQPEDTDSVRALLEAADLPSNGLERTGGWVAEEHGRVVGHIALERTSDAAVLRSLAITPSAQGRGLARRLMDIAESEAGDRTLLLRTKTIGPWAERRGYIPAKTDLIPASVRLTTEFEGSLCSGYPVYIKRVAAADSKPDTQSLMTQAVTELAAISAAMAANCEPCFKFHFDKAGKVGVSREDIRKAVNIGLSVKSAPHRKVVETAERFLASAEPIENAPASCCPPTASTADCGCRG